MIISGTITGLFMASSISQVFFLDRYHTFQIQKPNRPSQHQTSFSECENFSGVWKGKCNFQSGSEPSETTEDELVVRQVNCIEIEMNQTSITFGGNVSQTHTQGDSVRSSSTSLDWNNNKTQVTVTSTLDGRRLSKEENYTYSGTAIGSMKLDDGKLIVSDKIQTLVVFHPNGDLNNIKSELSCIYEKESQE